MKSRLIINPVSGTDSAPDHLQAINERLRAAFGEMDIVMTIGSGDATAAAEAAARAGDYDQLFVAGGDGTLNEVINGVARVAGAFERITFGLVYAFSETFVLPLSHDEVVHEKRSLIDKMLGSREERFAGLRALLAHQWAHPGK